MATGVLVLMWFLALWVCGWMMGMMSGADTDPAAMVTTDGLKRIRSVFKIKVSKCVVNDVNDRIQNVNTDTDALAPPRG